MVNNLSPSTKAGSALLTQCQLDLMLLIPPLELERTLGPWNFSSCFIDHISHFWLYKYRRFALTYRGSDGQTVVTYCKSLGWHWIYKLFPLWVWKHVEVLKPYFVYGNHSSSFLGIPWHLKAQSERCVIPVKHGLHFRGAVLPLRDPYRKFCLLE